MAWGTPHFWTLADQTPTHGLFNQDLISNPASLRNENDARVKVWRSSAISVANETRQAIAWNAQAYESSGMFDTGAATRLIALRNGIYLVQSKMAWASNSTGRRGNGYRVNGAGLDYDMQLTAANASSKQNGADMVMLEAGDYVEVYGYQSSGGALNMSGAGESSSSATLTLLATETPATDWTEPKVWATGDVLTPQLLNAQWRDNLLNLRYFGGQAAKVSLSENQSVTALERNPLSWDVEQWKIGGLWTNGSKFIARVAGWYWVIPTVEWRSEDTAAVGAVRGCGFTLGSTNRDFDLHFQSGSQAGVSSNGKSMVYLEVDDWIEIYAYHDNDQSLIINGGLDRTRVCVAWAASLPVAA